MKARSAPDPARGHPAVPDAPSRGALPCSRRVVDAAAEEGGPDLVLAAAAREAGSVLGAECEIVRFERNTGVCVACWPPASTSVWTGDVPERWWSTPAMQRGVTRTLGSHIAAPIMVDGTCWGAVIARDSGTGAGAVLTEIAGLVALFAAGCSVPGRPATHAAVVECDGLTGVPTHRAFRERLADEHQRAAASGTGLALVLIDIDRFKSINDSHGHLAGDHVLAEFAQRLASCARSTDFVARTGGEEFAWIMPGADATTSWEAAERFRTEVASRPIGPVDRVTASAGICTVAQARDLEELVRFAEGALYWAKDRGRDAAYVFTPDVVRVLSEDERTQQMSRAHAMRSIRVLARAVDAKDHSTREHSERVADLAVQIAIALGWSMERTAELRDAGLLHDVGKIGIPDAVLLKPGSLSDAEYELIKSHPALGARIASDVLSDEQQAWVRGHHERFDGRGYPDGLSGEQIPEGARILALADSWDVMTSVRSYRETWSLDEALLDCRAESGRQFWPDAVDALELLVDAGALLVQTPPPPPGAAGRPARATEIA
jgi:diguanylate cyclase (GGDEF)-like protein